MKNFTRPRNPKRPKRQTNKTLVKKVSINWEESDLYILSDKHKSDIYKLTEDTRKNYFCLTSPVLTEIVFEKALDTFARVPK